MSAKKASDSPENSHSRRQPTFPAVSDTDERKVAIPSESRSRRSLTNIESRIEVELNAPSMGVWETGHQSLTAERQGSFGGVS